MIFLTHTGWVYLDLQLKTSLQKPSSPTTVPFEIPTNSRGFRHPRGARGKFLSSPRSSGWINPLPDPRTFPCAARGATGALSFGAAALPPRTESVILDVLLLYGSGWRRLSAQLAPSSPEGRFHCNDCNSPSGFIPFPGQECTAALWKQWIKALIGARSPFISWRICLVAALPCLDIASNSLSTGIILNFTHSSR